MTGSELSRTFGKVDRSWKIVSLPQHVFFQEGPGLRNWQWTASGIKVINGRNILLDGSIDLSNTDRYISMKEFQSRYSHFAVEVGDIVVTSSGTIGKVGRIRPKHLPLMMNTSVIRFHPKNDAELDADFLYHFLRSPLFQGQAQTFATGAAQPNFGPAHLLQMKLVLPPYSTQRKIADILSAYDDLIENNARRIKILEEMAQMIYREWFVHFRFPGHEQVEMVEMELGMVPDGWEVNRLDNALVLQRGFDLPRDRRRHGRVPVLAATGVVDTHSEVRALAPGVVTGRSGSLGTVIYVQEDFWPLNTVLWVKEFRDVTPLHGFFLLQTLDLNSLNSGAAVPTLNRNYVHALPVVIPARQVIEEFDHHVLPMYGLMKNLRDRNDRLRSTRDLLLPKLVSGEVKVDQERLL